MISDEESQGGYKLLLNAINGGDCAIFVGAGISIPVRYPSLQGLLADMAKEANLDNLKHKKVDSKWPQDFQLIKDTLGDERYREFLLKTFDHTRRDQKFNDILLTVLSIPFCAFVTTNYDPCLEFASQKLATVSPQVYPYPNLPITELKGKHIFHPHGYMNPDDPRSVNSIILCEDEFQDADEIISNFYNALFLELDVLFIGFGWNDIAILNILEKTRQTRKKREGTAVKRDLQLFRERLKFALTDSETYERDRGQDNYMGKLGIIPIIYNKKGDSHFQLVQVIEEIQRQTSKEPIREIPTIPTGLFEPLGGVHD